MNAQFEKQVQEAAKLDALVVLTGENQNNPVRSEHAAKLYHAINRARYQQLPVVITGHWSGFNPAPCIEPEWQGVKRRLLERGVSEKDILIEGKALDTIANMYYSGATAAKHGFRTIGVITQPFHIERAMRAGVHMLPRNVHAVALASEETAEGATQERTNRLAALCVEAEMLNTGVAYKGIAPNEYMTEWHPFHNRYGKIRMRAGPYSFMAKIILDKARRT